MWLPRWLRKAISQTPSPRLRCISSSRTEKRSTSLQHRLWQGPLSLRQKINITKDDIDWFVPHQANVRIIETAAKKLGVPMDKFIVTLDHYGNTSSASIPLALCEATEKGIIRRGQKIALIGFGAGLTYGGIIMEY